MQSGVSRYRSGTGQEGVALRGVQGGVTQKDGFAAMWRTDGWRQGSGVAAKVSQNKS